MSFAIRWSVRSLLSVAAANLRVDVTSGDLGFLESCGVLDMGCVGESHGFNPTLVTLVLPSHLVHNVDVVLNNNVEISAA